MYYPTMKTLRQQRVTVKAFPGLDRREQAEPGGFWEMENLCSDGYPALEVRKRRAVAATVEKPNGLLGKDTLLWADGTALYVGGTKVTGPVLTDGEKQMVSMGAYGIVFPDGVYVNTQDLSDWGTLENRRQAAGGVSVGLCDRDGGALGSFVTGTEAPEEAENGTLWMDVSAAEPVLRQLSQQVWQAAENICVKLTATGLGRGFRAGDGITVEGLTEERLNGQTVLTAAGEDFIVFPGTVSGSTTQTEPVTAARLVPEMDFVVQSGNRLWGCKYGMVKGRAVNEIYASKLGDFRNWNCYQGLSTDSYAAVRGSDGVFTGAASFLGNPIFFKEQCMERVYAASNGGHQIVTVECSGVRKGCHRSIQTVEGTLYYLSGSGVEAFDGSLPRVVSQPLGTKRYKDGVAGSREGKYYLSAVDETGEHSLLVYDTRRNLWQREDGTKAVGFADVEEDLFCLTEEGQLLSMNGTSGTEEAAVCWEAVTGELGMETAEHKRLMRLMVYLSPEEGSRTTAEVSYDGGATWQEQTAFAEGSGRECVFLLRPHRCRTLRLRLSGRGGCRLVSLTAVYEKGSDGP